MRGRGRDKLREAAYLDNFGLFTKMRILVPQEEGESRSPSQKRKDREQERCNNCIFLAGPRGRDKKKGVASRVHQERRVAF